MLIGESSKPRGTAMRPSGPAGSTFSGGAIPPSVTSLVFSARVLASTSHLPRLEVDARIDPGISEVGNQINDQSNERENVEIGEHDRIVAVEHALEAQESEAVKREDRLNQERAGKEGADERRREAGDDQEHGVAEYMAVEHLPLGATLGARGQHVLPARFPEG